MADPRRPRALFRGSAHLPQASLVPFALPEYETALYEASTQLKLNTRLITDRLRLGGASADAFAGI